MDQLNDSLKQTLGLFGVDWDLSDSKAAQLVYVKYKAGKIGKFEVGYHWLGMDVAVGYVPVAGQAITLAKQGKLGPASQQAIKYQFEKVLSDALTQAKNHADNEENLDKPVKESKMDKKATTEVPQVPENTVINLCDANALHQKVHGTSAGSVYYVMALLDGAAIAVRSKNNTLSIRIEGTKLKMYEEALEDLGFVCKPKYASVHFDVAGGGLVSKTMGAVIGRLGFKNVIKVSDIAETV